MRRVIVKQCSRPKSNDVVWCIGRKRRVWRKRRHYGVLISRTRRRALTEILKAQPHWCKKGTQVTAQHWGPERSHVRLWGTDGTSSPAWH
jgi:hypothetical protein